jgi:hypothetical protein
MGGNLLKDNEKDNSYTIKKGRRHHIMDQAQVRRNIN